jgi:CRISPR-associated protein Cas5h
MAEKLIVFKLSGKFAHFNLPLTTPKYLKRTYNVIPKTTLLGILGAMLGYNGYEQNTKEPQFYSKLKHIKCFIIPEIYPFNKFLIKYNSLNSFCNNDKQNPNIIISEEILLNPCFIIGLLVDEIKDKELIQVSFDKISHYHLYLGKNEFFANIEPLGKELLDFYIINEKNIKIDSIFPITILQDRIDEIKSIILDNFQLSFEFTKDSFYPKVVDIGYLSDNETVQIKPNVQLIKVKELNKIAYLF